MTEWIIMDLLKKSRKFMSVRDIAKETKMTISSTSRKIKNLTKRLDIKIKHPKARRPFRIFKAKRC